MGFGDLKSPSGMQLLNSFLSDKSYIEGYVPSQADVAVFEAVGSSPPPELYHALRWYNHIKSYEKQKASLPGVKKALGKYGPADVEDSTGTGGDNKDDDDIDLLVLMKMRRKKLRRGLLAQYESKKAKTLVAKSSILLDVKPGTMRQIWPNWKTKLVPVGYGIKKLQIQCVVEDDKVGTDMLEEKITAFKIMYNQWMWQLSTKFKLW
ncbi:hypothetical protein E2320_020067 [Naja naja]|nr:hypothetical protein E2320_020067 [Naja naja]